MERASESALPAFCWCKEYGSPRTGGGGDHPGHHGGGACPGCAAPGASQGEARPRVRLSRPGCTYLIRNARCASRHVKFTLWVTRETSECANRKYNMHISFQTRPVPKHVPKLPLRQRRAPLPLPPEFGTRVGVGQTFANFFQKLRWGHESPKFSRKLRSGEPGQPPSRQVRERT